MDNVGKNIADERKRLGLTQEELASRVGYKSKSTINKIEMGTRDLPQRKIALFADALGVTPGHLMGWDKPVVTDPHDKENNDVATDIVIKLGDDKVFCECVKLLYSMDAEKMATARRLLACL